MIISAQKRDFNVIESITYGITEEVALEKITKSPDVKKHAGGRPRKKVDETLVFKLASIGCTMAEIGHVCDCSSDLLERRFAGVIKKGRDMGKVSLRRLQWKGAEQGNVTMQIWLGKQLLDQTDKREKTVTFKKRLDDFTDDEIDSLLEDIEDRYGKDRVTSSPTIN